MDYPKRLNLGCGFDIREGFLNVDLHARHNPDIVADVTDLSELPNGYFEEIVAQDVLEHLERHKTVQTLQRWSDLLVEGGVIEIRVPSIMDLFEFLASPDWRTIDRTEEALHLMYGTQAYTGDYHLAGFTAEILTEYLRRARLQICYAELLHSWLFVVRARKTDALSSPREIAHSAYFRILGRAGDECGLVHLESMTNNGRSSDEIDNLLMSSPEYKFRQSNPSYLVKYQAQLHPPQETPTLNRRLKRLFGR